MNSKNDSKLSYKQPHVKPKQKKTKQQLEQKQNHRNGDHMEGYQ